MSHTHTLEQVALAAGAVTPAPRQLAWQELEFNAFFHFGVNTFTDREWGLGTEPEAVFNPTALDAGQWAQTCRDAGIRMLILTAKHHDGFCLWPSRYTEHSVKNSPWKDGKGDVVRELSDACKAEGIRMGVYLSPWDRHEKTYGDSPKYNDHFVNQLTDLLTNYGPIAEVWFDGACGEGPNGKKQVYDWPRFHETVHKLQPEAVIFSDAGPGVRWIGNEAGTAGDPCWAMMDPATVPQPGVGGDDVINALQHGYENGTVWRPGECDVSIRPGWFYHPKEDDKVRSVDNLVDLYFKSVGRNALLLLNVPPNREGLLSDPDVKALTAFRAELDRIFAKDLAAGKKATADNTRGGSPAFAPDKVLDGDMKTYWATNDGVTSAWIAVDLGAPTEFNVACMREAIVLGQRVKAYRIEVADDAGNWKTISKGTTIGHKKLDAFDAVKASKVRLIIEDARACPTIYEFSLYRK